MFSSSECYELGLDLVLEGCFARSALGLDQGALGLVHLRAILIRGVSRWLAWITLEVRPCSYDRPCPYRMAMLGW